ncbi:MAG TPA: hypothetical protein VK186_20275, partial [Candidatus Deferrimicrobium sp.]|nr:hypothetical protein [Candidatus Deferrimicrobium sp.]
FEFRASDLLFEEHLPVSLHFNQKENDVVLGAGDLHVDRIAKGAYTMGTPFKCCRRLHAV